VHTKDIERDYGPRNMEYISDKDVLAIQRNDSSAATLNRKAQVVSHPDLKACNRLVRDTS
jgi:hypothetical protein